MRTILMLPECSFRQCFWRNPGVGRQADDPKPMIHYTGNSRNEGIFIQIYNFNVMQKPK